MQIRLTLRFDEQQRRAIARSQNRQTPASRTQAVQWISDTLATQLERALAELRQWQREHAPEQLELGFEESERKNA